MVGDLDSKNEVNKAFEGDLFNLARYLGGCREWWLKSVLTFKILRLWCQVSLALAFFYPLLVVGFLLRIKIKELFSVSVVATIFICWVAGYNISLALTEKGLSGKKRPVVEQLENLSFKQALWIGLAQYLH